MITQDQDLTEAVERTTVIADIGYDRNVFLENKSCMHVISPRENRRPRRSYDQHIDKERYLIECFFGKMKHFRCVFLQFEKTAKTLMRFLSFVQMLIGLG